jgi:hypothetical protein
LRCSEKRNATDVLEEELQGIGRDLGRELDLRFRLVFRGDDGDPRLF